GWRGGTSRAGGRSASAAWWQGATSPGRSPIRCSCATTTPAATCRSPRPAWTRSGRAVGGCEARRLGAELALVDLAAALRRQRILAPHPESPRHLVARQAAAAVRQQLLCRQRAREHDEGGPVLSPARVRD